LKKRNEVVARKEELLEQKQQLGELVAKHQTSKQRAESSLEESLYALTEMALHFWMSRFRCDWFFVCLFVVSMSV
jgi:hypothetical protein